MTADQPAREPESPRPGRVLRWTGWIEKNDDLVNGFDVYPSEAWREKWEPPCPDGDQVAVRRALGYRERSVSELELRVVLGPGQDGVCQAIVDEREDEIYVRLLVHVASDRGDLSTFRDHVDCPVRVWLDHPLGERAVIDSDTDEELLRFTPAYLDNIPQPDHGYCSANRRKRRGRDWRRQP